MANNEILGESASTTYGWWLPLPDVGPRAGSWLTTNGGQLVVSDSADGLRKKLENFGHGEPRVIPSPISVDTWWSEGYINTLTIPDGQALEMIVRPATATAS